MELSLRLSRCTAQRGIHEFTEVAFPNLTRRMGKDLPIDFEELTVLSIEELYQQYILSRPASERLYLVERIVRDLAQQLASSEAEETAAEVEGEEEKEGEEEGLADLEYLSQIQELWDNHP